MFSCFTGVKNAETKQENKYLVYFLKKPPLKLKWFL